MSTVTDNLTRADCEQAILDWRDAQRGLELPADQVEYLRINDMINNWLGLLTDLPCS